jgi:hypothetical protein
MPSCVMNIYGVWMADSTGYLGNLTIVASVQFIFAMNALVGVQEG